jgi:nitronate monooxygenase
MAIATALTRLLANDFSMRWHGEEAALERKIAAEREKYWAAAKAGDVSTAVVFAGEGLDLVHDIRPAGEIVNGIVAEAERLLCHNPNFRLVSTSS